MGQDYDTGGALRRPFEAPTGTGTLFGQTMGLVAVTAAGYATRQDLSALARVLWWALIALIAVGVVLVLDLLNVFQFFLSLRSESQLTAQTAPWTTRRT